MADVLTELVAKITTDASGLKSGMAQAEDATNKASKNMSESLRRVGIAMVATGAAITAAMGMAVKSAMNAVESENLFTVSLGKNARAARDWSNKLGQALGINTYELRKQVGVIYTMVSSMGLGEEAALDMAEGVTQLAYDMASFYNLPVEEAFNKIKSGLVGMPRPLQDLGIVINETAAQTWAFKTGLVAQGDEMTNQQKVMARYGALLEQTGVSQGDMARTIDSPVNKLRVMGSTFEELKVIIGTHLLPAFSKLLDSFSGVLAATRKWTESFPNLTGALSLVTVGVGGVLSLAGGIILLMPQIIKLRDGFIAVATSAGIAKGSVLAFYGALLLIPAAITAIIMVHKKLQSQWSAEALNPTAYAWAKIDTEIKNIDGSIRKVYEDFKIYSQEEADRLEKLGYTISYVGKQAADAAKKTASEEEYTKGAAAIQKLKDAFGDLGNAIKSKGDQARYASEQTRQALDRELDSARNNYNIQIGLISKLYADKIKYLNAGANSQINAIQDQIDAIDKQTADEELALTRAAEQKRINELKESDDTTALREYQTEVARNELLRQRDAEKDALRVSIELIRTKTKTQEDALNEELAAAQQNEKDILDATERRMADAKILLDKALETTLKQLAQELQDKIDNETKLLGATENRLADEETAQRESYVRQLAEATKYVDDLIAQYGRVSGVGTIGIAEGGAGAGMTVEQLAENYGMSIESARATVEGYRANPTSEEYAPVANILERVKGYATGGIVPGPIGAPVLATVHGGETIIQANESMGMTVNISGPLFMEREDQMNQLVDKIRKGIDRSQRLRFGGAYSGG